MGHKVLALGRSKKPPSKLLEFANYRSIDIVDIVPDLECKICIHCAGLATDKEPAQSLNRINISGTQNVFDHIHCDHFIYLSSASVYPPTGVLHTEEEIIDETKLSAYGFSKLKAEQYLLQQTTGQKITIIRPRAVYGIGDRILLPRILRLKKGPLLITPAMLNYNISITNIENLMYATDKVISQDQNRAAVYNVVDDTGQTLEEMIKKIFQLLDFKPSMHFKIPQRLLLLLGKLFPYSDINSNTLKYYLCHHQLSNLKIKQALQVDFPSNFSNYKNKYQAWIQKIGIEALKTTNADLSWWI